MGASYVEQRSIELDLDELIQDESLQAAREDEECIDALVEQLVAHRKAARLNQTELADLMQTSQSTISEFENRNGDPYFSTLQRYARALGMRMVAGVLPEASNIDYLFEPRTQSRRIAFAQGLTDEENLRPSAAKEWHQSAKSA